MQDVSYILSGRHTGMPLLINSAYEEKITDVKNGEYIDYVLGNLTQILGHRGVPVNEVFKDVADKYYNVGDNPNIHAIKLAEKIIEISKMDMVRFTNSGSEAVHLALRVARAYSGKNKVLKFVSHYHGWFDEPIEAFVQAKVSDGICKEITNNMIAVQWNDKEAVKQAFEAYGDDIAAVILEPVLVHSGTIPPFDDFLVFLRNITKENDVLLIFDECVTGFRIAVGGAQEFYNVSADLVVYSKAISGGIPIGVLAGKENVMNCLKNGQVYQASTYDGNPLSSAIALKIIKIIQERNICGILEKNGNKLMDGMKNVFDMFNQQVLFQGVGAAFQFYFTDKDRITCHADAMTTDWRKFQRFIQEMLKRNIHMSEGELWSSNCKRNWIGSVFVSISHDEEAVRKTLDAAVNTLKDMV